MSHKSNRRTRKPNEIKPVQKGHKSQRGVPELYDEPKKSTSYGLTSTGKVGISILAQHHALSASELIEQIGRGYLIIISIEELALIQEPIKSNILSNQPNLLNYEHQ
ncbi:MAG: hypothetical protein ACTS2F_25355 [Thainema sp.]